MCALLLVEVYGTEAAGGVLEGLRGKTGNVEGPVRRHWWYFVGYGLRITGGDVCVGRGGEVGFRTGDRSRGLANQASLL